MARSRPPQDPGNQRSRRRASAAERGIKAAPGASPRAAEARLAPAIELSPRAAHVLLGLLFAGALVAWILFASYTRMRLEDALITFRYAENLALGKGFVYNAGERVLGTTTPLFA